MYGNNTLNGKFRARFSIVLIIMLVGALNFLCIIAESQNAPSNSIYYIESDFILWRDNEKAIDPNFTIHLIYNNYTVNNSFTYYIRLNNNIYNGTANFNYSQPIKMNDRDIISIFEIKINNQTLANFRNIRIIGGVDQSGISRAVSQYTISLSPFQWTLKGRNIFYSVIVGGILCVLISYRLVLRYRKKHGVKIIKDE